MTRDEPHQMRIRIPKKLHSELEEEASRKSISINSEVINRLQGGLNNDEKDALLLTLNQLMLTQLNLLAAHLGMSIRSTRMLLVSIRDGITIDKDELAEILKDTQESEHVMAQVLSRWRKEMTPNALSLETLQLGTEPESKNRPATPPRKKTGKA